MNYKQKLTDLLCTVPEIKEDIVKKEFTISVKRKNKWNWATDYYNNLRILECKTKEEALWICISGIKNTKEYKDYHFNFEVILENEKDLEERMLRMYCKNKQYNFDGEWFIEYDTQWFDDWKYFGSYEYIRLEWLDNTKPFSQQEDSVYQKIYEFLEANK